MFKFGVRFIDGSCKVFVCRDINGVRWLTKVNLRYERNRIESMLCFCNGEIWKWKKGKWELKLKKEIKEEKEKVVIWKKW